MGYYNIPPWYPQESTIEWILIKCVSNPLQIVEIYKATLETWKSLGIRYYRIPSHTYGILQVTLSENL